MKISVMVTGAPYSSQASQSAYYFCRSAHNEGHHLSQVFFYQDGVHNGSRLSIPPQDEANIIDDWVGLAGDTGVSLVVCIAAAQRRGILDVSEARREELDADNLHPAFTLAGLGLLTESVIESERFVSFG
jgi:tRNA 2-thiouridine synthesizing protein D